MAATSLRAVVKTVSDFITSFVNNTNNPTNVTAEQAGAYDKEEIDTLLAAKLRTDAVPLAVWGAGTVGTAMGVTVSGQTLTIPSAPLTLGGLTGTFQASLQATLANGVTMYVAAEYLNGAFVARLYDKPVVESNTSLAIGSITGNSSNGLTLTGFVSVVRIAGFRLSSTKVPNAIPISDANGSLNSWV